MLYDHKRWDKPEIKANPFSLDSLVAWLEKQPTRKVYCYKDTGHCLLSQYFTAMGFENITMGSSYFLRVDRSRVELPPHFDNVAISYPRTFGKALACARRFQNA